MKKSAFIFLLLIICIALAIRLFLFYQGSFPYHDGELLQINTRVASEPSVSGKLQRFQIRLPRGGRAIVSTTKFPDYYFNQQLRIKGKLQITEKEKGRRLVTLLYPQIESSTSESNLVYTSTSFVREKASTIFESSLSPNSSALLLGIVFGIKKDMSKDFLQELQSAGVMHVIAASGMNVTMVAGGLIFLLQRLFNRRLALVFSLLGIGFYTVLAGMEASIVRAAIMASIAFMAGMQGKQNLPVYALFLTGAGMLFFDPSLINDVGFQLSFLATGGIMQLKPVFSSLEHVRIGSVLGEDFTTTLSAQLSTLPILLANFGSVNLLSIVVNMLVLWTIPPLMVIGSMAVFLGLFFVPLGQLLAYCTLPFLWYFETIVHIFNHIQLPLQVDNVPFSLSLGYYIILVSVITFINKKSLKSTKQLLNG